MSEKSWDRMVYVLVILMLVGLLGFLGYIIWSYVHTTKPVVFDATVSQESVDVVINLEPGEKLQTINWERDNNHGYLYILTRPMHSGESPETYRYRALNSKFLNSYEIHEMR